MNIDKMIEFLFVEWNLMKPKFIISIEGNSSKISIKQSLRESFSKSLVKAAATTSYFILKKVKYRLQKVKFRYFLKIVSRTAKSLKK